MAVAVGVLTAPVCWSEPGTGGGSEPGCVETGEATVCDGASVLNPNQGMEMPDSPASGATIPQIEMGRGDTPFPDTPDGGGYHHGGRGR